MKIATWNLERPHKTTKRLPAIYESLKKVNADILILTETNELIHLGSEYKSHHAAKPIESFYKAGETRVSIYSRFRSTGSYHTFRNNTSICINFETPIGELACYGTILGANGNKRKDFIEDLDQQISDYERIGKENNICIAGDLNMTFSDNYYFTIEGRQKLQACFEKLHLINLTGGIPENIDHIILPQRLLENRHYTLEAWNLDKTLSDHIGVAVTLIDK